MSEKSCQDRIADEMWSREETASRLLRASSGETICRHCGVTITEVIDAETDDSVWVDSAWHPVCREGGNVLTGHEGHHEPDEEYGEDSLYEFGLEVSRKVTLKFLMSTGGPADWLEITCHEVRHGAHDAHPTSSGYVTLEVESVTYHFSDWYDHAEEEVREGSALWQLAEWVAQGQES